MVVFLICDKSLSLATAIHPPIRCDSKWLELIRVRQREPLIRRTIPYKVWHTSPSSIQGIQPFHFQFDQLLFCLRRTTISRPWPGNNDLLLHSPIYSYRLAQYYVSHPTVEIRAKLISSRAYRPSWKNHQSSLEWFIERNRSPFAHNDSFWGVIWWVYSRIFHLFSLVYTRWPI